MPALGNALFDLTGKVAIVTGGNGGIGLGMAMGMAKAGARIVVAARNAEKSAAAVKTLSALGPEARAVNVDVADSASIKAMVTEVAERCGRIDILVNNAGTNIRKRPEDLPESEWRPLATRDGSALMCRRNCSFVPLIISSLSILLQFAFLSSSSRM